MWCQYCRHGGCSTCQVSAVSWHSLNGLGGTSATYRGAVLVAYVVLAVYTILPVLCATLVTPTHSIVRRGSNMFSLPVQYCSTSGGYVMLYALQTHSDRCSIMLCFVKALSCLQQMCILSFVILSGTHRPLNISMPAGQPCGIRPTPRSYDSRVQAPAPLTSYD